MSYLFKPKHTSEFAPPRQLSATTDHRQDLIEKSDSRNRPGQRTYNVRNARANVKGKGDVGGNNKHHEPRFNLHEIPKIIRVMQCTNGHYEEAAAWERYLHHYRNYEKLMVDYTENVFKFKAKKLDREPRRPTMPAEPDGAYYAEKRGAPRCTNAPRCIKEQEIRVNLFRYKAVVGCLIREQHNRNKIMMMFPLKPHN